MFNKPVIKRGYEKYTASGSVHVVGRVSVCRRGKCATITFTPTSAKAHTIVLNIRSSTASLNIRGEEFKAISPFERKSRQ